MNPRASVPKIFLRGNRYYVRVQVPKSMQDRLRRREYWVSLRTSDRSVAMQRAATAAQRKRHEVVSAFRLLGDAAEVLAGQVDDPIKVVMSGTVTEQGIGVVHPGDEGGMVNIATNRGLEVRITHASKPSAKTGSVSKRSRIRTQPVEDFIDQGRILFPVKQRVDTFDTIEALRDAIDRGDVPKSGRVPLLQHDLPDLDFWVGKRIGYGTPCRKLFRSELQRPTKPLSSWVSGYSERGAGASDGNQITAGSYSEGTRDVRNIFGTKAFNHAKPVSLIRELVRQSTGPGDIVLDFFAGSATTAQAVMELNAEDGMDRKFIMVSTTEATKEDPTKNLCRNVTAERIRRLNASTDPNYEGLVAGFAYLHTERIPIEHVDLALDPAAAWASLEALHGLPLTAYDQDLPWNCHETEEFTLVLVDRYEPALLDWVRTRQSPIHVYTWAKGVVWENLTGPGIQVSLVGETLIEAFTG